MPSFTRQFQSASRARLLTATENELTALGEQLSVAALLPKGRDYVTYLPAHAAVIIGIEGLVGKFDAAHYRGNPLDNPGLPSDIEHTVINDRIGGLLAYPILWSRSEGVIGAASDYASHDETGSVIDEGGRRRTGGKRVAQPAHQRHILVPVEMPLVESAGP